MKNNDLNVFEILGEKEPESKKRQRRDRRNTDRDKNELYSWDINGQEQDVPDPFFRDAIKHAISQDEQEFISPKKKKAPLRKYLERYGKGLLVEAAVVVLAVLFISNFIVSITYVSGDSMKPNFYDGDRIVVLRLAKGSIEKGDVIVFKTQQGEKLIKRVVATEGDTVDISSTQGGLYINGKAVEEDNIYSTTSAADDKVTYPVVVEEDSYFVLGDNRTGSKDSRDSEIGLIKKKDVIGKVVLNIRGV